MKSHEDRLTEQEKEWFYALMQDRADNAKEGANKFLI